MKETLLLLFLKGCVTNNLVTVIRKNNSLVKGNLKYGCNIKKKKKTGTDYFTFVFSQSKSEPKLFHSYAKCSEFMSATHQLGLLGGSPRNGHTQ